jgi:hypothetical protein
MSHLPGIAEVRNLETKQIRDAQSPSAGSLATLQCKIPRLFKRSYQELGC